MAMCWEGDKEAGGCPIVRSEAVDRLDALISGETLRVRGSKWAEKKL